MKKIFLIMLILISSCTTEISNNKNNNKIEFTEKMTFSEFKQKLKEYSKNSSYPNIDN